VVHTVLSVMIEPATNRAYTGPPAPGDPPA
jgi:hypothetical protein